MADMSYYDNHKPDYGDQIVFEDAGGLPYTFRVVGIAGHDFRLVNDIPVIDGVGLATKYLRDTNLLEGPAEIYLETFPNGKSHEIIISKTVWEHSILTTEAQFIPEGYVFVAGDRRDNAMDSRYIGLISYAQIIGKCQYLYWSQRMSRIGTRLDL